jgi:2-keto-4-pentenoate hydratase
MYDPSPAAAALDEVRRTGAESFLPEAIGPRTVAEGCAVQFERARRSGAVPPAGFKIGATTKRMQDYLGLDGPAAGYMVAAHLLPSGTRMPHASLRGPGAECEIGLRLARDIPFGPCTQAQAAEAVAEVFAAIEIVENRYGTPPLGDLARIGTPTLVADQVYHRAAILSAGPADWRGLDLAAIPGRVAVDGLERAAGHGRDLLGYPLAALAWLAGSPTAAAFGGLKAGQVVMLGSVTPPIWLDRPCHVSVAFEGLGEATVTLT